MRLLCILHSFRVGVNETDRDPCSNGVGILGRQTTSDKRKVWVTADGAVTLFPIIQARHGSRLVLGSNSRGGGKWLDSVLLDQTGLEPRE